MSFATDHAGALADLREDGAAVTFSTGTPGAYDAATDTFGAPTAASVTGYAIQTAPKAGEEEQFRALGSALDRRVMLLVAPTTYGGTVSPGARVTWASVDYTVAFVTAVAPDGTTILLRVGCTR